MPDATMPASLGLALATEPWWLKTWLLVLGGVQMLGVFFVATRAGGEWQVRREPIAVLASLIAAALFMDWLYLEVGYVRLLGLAHLVCWSPVYFWILSRGRSLDNRSLFGTWRAAYLIVVGLSLVVDFIDLIRHFAGDGQLLGRWT